MVRTAATLYGIPRPAVGNNNKAHTPEVPRKVDSVSVLGTGVRASYPSPALLETSLRRDQGAGVLVCIYRSRYTSTCHFGGIVTLS